MKKLLISLLLSVIPVTALFLPVCAAGAREIPGEAPVAGHFYAAGTDRNGQAALSSLDRGSPKVGNFVRTYDIKVEKTENGTVSVNVLGATPGAVITVTCYPDEGYQVGSFFVTDANGRAVTVSVNLNGSYSFIMPLTDVKVSVTFTGKLPRTRFTDVPSGAYYEDAVVWALKNRITLGTGETAFGPDSTVERGQAVTFLWRAAGSPEPAAAGSPFTDISAGDYFYKAVLWAVEAGITKGISDTQFGPHRTLERDQLLTFLHRAAGADAAGGGDWSAQAMQWAAAEGVSEGIPGAAGAKDPCPRRDVVYYLWKYYGQG